MNKINAVITGVGGYVPNYVFTNEEISQIVDTSDEWIMSRIGIKERRILKKEEGVGLSYMATKAVQVLIEKTGLSPLDVTAVVCATTTPDYLMPNTASLVATNLGMNNAFGFDMSAACSGFIFGLEAGAGLIATGRHKKVIVIAGDQLSTITNYTDRNTAPIFGDGCGAVLLEPTTENIGVMDSVLRSNSVASSGRLIAKPAKKQHLRRVSHCHR